MSADEQSWIGFLRAVNLGARRKFPKDAIKAVVEAVGGTGVETYINTGNVRFDHPCSDRAEMERRLEEAFAEDRGFEVPTICFTPAELAAVAAEAETIGAAYDGVYYISLLKSTATASACEALEAKAGRDVPVRDRAAHLLAGEAYHTSTLDNALVERHLGVATARSAKVIRTIVERWG
ncbi:MAG: DUF1697 domain-containing protein [Nocardioides sp.]|nr:DUF1697 domain-containing protein [Nocardioides sp.]